MRTKLIKALLILTSKSPHFKKIVINYENYVEVAFRTLHYFVIFTYKVTYYSLSYHKSWVSLLTFIIDKFHYYVNRNFYSTSRLGTTQCFIINLSLVNRVFKKPLQTSVAEHMFATKALYFFFIIRNVANQAVKSLLHFDQNLIFHRVQYLFSELIYVTWIKVIEEINWSFTIPTL
jgi:hypothetical protein